MKWQGARLKRGTWTLTGSEGIRRASDAEMAKLAQAGSLGPKALAAWKGCPSGGSAPPAPPPASGAPSAEPGSYASAAQAWHEAASAACAEFEAEGREREHAAQTSEPEGSLVGAMREELRARGMEPRDEPPPPAA